MSWSETALFNIGRDLYTGVSNHSPEQVAQVAESAEALHEIAQELKRRFPLS